MCNYDESWVNGGGNGCILPDPTPLYKNVEAKELENLQEYRKLVESIGTDVVVGMCNALESARKKHPVFCFRFMNNDSEHVDAMVKAIKELNDSNDKLPTAADILVEEVYEMLEAFGKGRLNECINEIDDCMAVLIRMRKFVDVLYTSVKTMGV